jgi:hypothetical protein
MTIITDPCTLFSSNTANSPTQQIGGTATVIFPNPNPVGKFALNITVKPEFSLGGTEILPFPISTGVTIFPAPTSIFTTSSGGGGEASGNTQEWIG